jgi:hypothetical protein
LSIGSAGAAGTGARRLFFVHLGRFKKRVFAGHNFFQTFFLFFSMVCGQRGAGCGFAPDNVKSQPGTAHRGRKERKTMGGDPVIIIGQFVLFLLGM